MPNSSPSNQDRLSKEEWLRLRLVTAFDGDVVKASIALDFVNRGPEASERYQRFKQWERENYREYCLSKGIKIGYPNAKVAQ